MASSFAICRRRSCLLFQTLLTRPSCPLYFTWRTRPSCIVHRWTIDTTVVSIVHLWTIHDGRVRRVKYKGHDGRVRNIHLKMRPVGVYIGYQSARHAVNSSRVSLHSQLVTTEYRTKPSSVIIYSSEKLHQKQCSQHLT